MTRRADRRSITSSFVRLATASLRGQELREDVAAADRAGPGT